MYLDIPLIWCCDKRKTIVFMNFFQIFSVDELDGQLTNWLSKAQHVDGPIRALIAP